MAGRKDIVEEALALIAKALQSENEIKNVKVGSSALQFRKTPEGTVELYSLRTPQSQRGKGNARSAMEHFLSQADALNLPVKLDASPLDKKTDTQRLVNFYNSLGFEQTGRSNNYVGDPEMMRQPVNKITDKANGGSIRQGYQTKGRVVGDIVEQALKLVMGAGDEAAPVSRIGMNYKDVTKRVPELTEAAKRLQAGEIGQSEYSAMVDRFKPVEPYASVPNPASVEDMVRALTANKREKIGKLADYPEGHPVALRLDIPAYTAHGVWVPTIHDQKTFKSISHEPAAHITGAQFSIPENKALAVAAGGAKGPFATIDGSLLKTPPEAIHERAKAAMNDPDWVQVGMDPERHSYFYDRKTMQPVISAEEVIQVGPLVLARKPVYGNAEGFKYSKGGSIREGYGPGGWVDDVVKMAGKVISGEGEDAAKAGIRAYQGSPHNFAAERLVRFPTGKEEYLVGQPDVLPDVPEGAEVLQDFPLGRMRMDKIGTGEGAQAYGHGLYYAEHEPVAIGYRRSLAGPESMGTVTFDGRPVVSGGSPAEGWDDPNLILGGNIHARDLAETMLRHNGDVDAAVSELRGKSQSALERAQTIKNEKLRQMAIDGAKTTSDMADLLQANPDRYGVKIPGSMYEVRINADPDAFLDWDKPLSEQPSLTRALGNYDPEYYVDYDEIIHKAMQSLQPVREPTGEDIYRALGHPKAATRMLNTMGVPGIRFLDAGSRVYDDTAIGMIKNYGSREKALEVAQKRLASAHHSDRASWQKTVDALSRPETRNLVVFDDKLISIIRKYGIAGASAMLGYNLMEQLDPKQALAASMADQDYQASRPQRSMGGNNSISGALNVARGLYGDR